MNGEITPEKLLTGENLSKLCAFLNESKPTQLRENDSISSEKASSIQRKIDMISAILPYLDLQGQDLAKRLISVLSVAKALYLVLETIQ